MLKSVEKRAKKRAKMSKTSNSFYRECCDYTTSRKNNWDRHLSSKKHLKKTLKNVENALKKTSKKRAKVYICEHCGVEYKDRSGLWYHKKKCLPCESDSEDESEEEKEDKPTQGGVFLTTEQLNLILSHKTMGNNNTNCNNTYNNNITVQVYLDEHCKDAKTIEEIGKKLIQDVQIKLNDIVYQSNSQLIKDAPADLFIKEIKKLPAEERPVHCADGKRGKFWVNKDKEGWVKEDVNEECDLKQKIMDFKTRVYGNCVGEIYDKAYDEERPFTEKETNMKSKLYHELCEKKTVDNAIIAKLASEFNIKDAIKDIEKTD